MRRIAISLAAAATLAGCAVSNETYPRSAVTTVFSPPVSNVPTIYTTAPRAPLHSELFACNSWGSNLGLIGQRGEATNYTPYVDTPAGALLRNPTEVGCLSSGFGFRTSTGGARQHNGVDLANREGGFIYAAGDGRIVSADYRTGFGNFIEIDHGNGVHTRYAHMAEFDPNLRPGARIAAGAPMGRMGMTGNATGVHLHYEIIVDGLQVDPINYGAPQPFVTTPVTHTYQQPIPIAPTPVEGAPPETIVEQPIAPPATVTPAIQNYPEPVRLQRPDGMR
ncbi:MAG: M23 family metallopeptidase [Hyphomonadaceae bacterium]|nr:M23 family metallopeptidase [Hyphomonadaceae bacterium]